MNRTHVIRLLARLLVVVPLLWSVHPLHGPHHVHSESDGGHTHPGGIETVQVEGKDFLGDDGKPSPSTDKYLDSATHCESGPCVASVDMGIGNFHQGIDHRRNSLHRGARGALIPPRTRPPRLV